MNFKIEYSSIKNVCSVGKISSYKDLALEKKISDTWLETLQFRKLFQNQLINKIIKTYPRSFFHHLGETRSFRNV